MENIDLALLEKWLSDPSFVSWAKHNDDEAIAKWEEYLNGEPLLWETAKAGRKIILGIPFKEISRDKAKAEKSLNTLFEKLSATNSADRKEDIRPQHKTKILKIRRRWLMAASMVVFMLISSVAYFQFFESSEVLLSTRYGEQTEILMPDGSTVTLNSNSRITYNTKNPRLVRLEGEAFFEVAKMPETNEKFLVITPDLAVNVLGTSFNVNARNDQTKVFLEEGIVELEIEDVEEEVIKMKPGDLITYSKKENKLKENRKNVSVIENVSWKEGAIIFNKTPLTEALFDIEDIYGIQFVIETDNLKEEEITGGVPIRDLKVTLETLNEVYGIQIRSEGQRYFLSNRKD